MNKPLLLNSRFVEQNQKETETPEMGMAGKVFTMGN